MKVKNEKRRSIIASLRYRAVLLRRRLDPRKKRQYVLDRLVGPVGFWNRLRSYQLNALVSAGLAPHHSLLDIGCGPLQGGIAFIDYLDKDRYVGVDVAEEPLTWAYRLISEHKLARKNPRIIASDTFGLDEMDGRKFDFIWLSQVMYHLDSETIDRLMRAIVRFAHSDTVAYGDILCAERPGLKPDSLWRNFQYFSHSVDEISLLAANYGLHVEPLGRLDKFGYPAELTRATNQFLKISVGVKEKPSKRHNQARVDSSLSSTTR